MWLTLWWILKRTSNTTNLFSLLRFHEVGWLRFKFTVTVFVVVCAFLLHAFHLHTFLLSVGVLSHPSIEHNDSNQQRKVCSNQNDHGKKCSLLYSFIGSINYISMVKMWGNRSSYACGELKSPISQPQIKDYVLLKIEQEWDTINSDWRTRVSVSKVYIAERPGQLAL